MLQVNNRDTRKRQLCPFDVFIVNFQRISHVLLLSLFLTLAIYLFTGYQSLKLN